MKFVIVAVLFLGAVSADVSHLNNVYLPSVHPKLTQKQHHISYVRESQVIPQSAVQEVADNSVVENASAEQKIYGAVNNNLQNSDFLAQHVRNVANFAHQLKAYAQQAPTTAEVPVSEVHVESNHFDTAPIANIHAVVGQHVHNAAALAHHVKAHAQQAVAVKEEKYAAPSSEVYQSNQRQAYYYQQQEKQEEQDHKPYYAGAVVQQYGETRADATVPQQEQQEQQQYHYVEQHTAPVVEHNVVVTVPAVQQQKSGHYGQQSYAVHSKATAGIDTQYAGNGGYVY